MASTKKGESTVAETQKPVEAVVTAGKESLEQAKEAVSRAQSPVESAMAPPQGAGSARGRSERTIRDSGSLGSGSPRTSSAAPIDKKEESATVEANRAFLQRAMELPGEDLYGLPGGDSVPARATAELLGGEATIGQAVRNPSDLARAVQAGLPAAVLNRLRQAGLSGPELEKIVAPARTLTRRRKEGRLSVNEGAAVERVARILVIADSALGGRAAALAWLRQPKTARLGGSAPLDYLRSDIGARIVEEILLQAEYGLTA